LTEMGTDDTEIIVHAAGASIAAKLKIQNFTTLAERCQTGESQEIPLCKFKDRKFSFRLYPNGAVERWKGNVCVFINRDGDDGEAVTGKASRLRASA